MKHSIKLMLTIIFLNACISINARKLTIKCIEISSSNPTIEMNEVFPQKNMLGTYTKKPGTKKIGGNYPLPKPGAYDENKNLRKNIEVAIEPHHPFVIEIALRTNKEERLFYYDSTTAGRNDEKDICLVVSTGTGVAEESCTQGALVHFKQ